MSDEVEPIEDPEENPDKVEELEGKSDTDDPIEDPEKSDTDDPENESNTDGPIDDPGEKFGADEKPVEEDPVESPVEKSSKPVPGLVSSSTV